MTLRCHLKINIFESFIVENKQAPFSSISINCKNLPFYKSESFVSFKATLDCIAI